MVSLTQILDATRRRHGERVALVDGERALTYAELHDRVGRAAAVLRGLGAASDDRVCILALNSHRVLEVLLGAVWAGAVAAPLNMRLAPAELAAILADVEPVALFVDDAHLALGRELTADAGGRIRLALMSDSPAPGDVLDYEAELAAVTAPPDAGRGDEDVATLFFTGGTTSRPKGVMQTHANLVTSALMYVGRFGYTHETVLLGSAPLFHVAAAAVIPPVLMAGGKIVLMPRFDAAGYLDLIAHHRVTFANGVPTMFRLVLDAAEGAAHDLSSVEGMNYGGAPMPAELLQRLVRLFPHARFYPTYGLTEVTSAATVGEGVALSDAPLADETRWRTIGYPTPLTDVRVFDPEDRECPPGEIGELVIRGPLVMKGYWRNPEATATALRGGWFRTGDLGYHDGRGGHFLVDRLKDMIITGGENVYSTEVEAAIRTLPGVSDVAVIGLPHETWGEAVHAVVVQAPGAALEAAQVVAHCRGCIAGYKTPRSVDVRLEPLPLSGAGKVDKTVLRRERVGR